MKHFGVRAGFITDDELLRKLNAVEHAEAGTSLAEHEIALRDAIHAIQPVTLSDLRRGHDPFRARQAHPNGGTFREQIQARLSRGGTQSSLTTVFVFAVAFLCLALQFYFTLWERDAAQVVAQASTLRHTEQESILAEVEALVTNHEAEIADETRAVTYALVSQRLKELGSYLRERRSLVSQASNISESFDPLSRIRRVEPVSYEVPSGRNPLPKSEWCPTGTVYTWQTDTVECRILVAAGAIPNDVFDPTIVADNVWENRKLRDQAKTVESQLYVVRTWLLPLIYGALGASVYSLRRRLDPIHPNPKFWQTLIRVFFGGFAGISISWLWLPYYSLEADLATVSISALAVSFLFGYWIDGFFKLLDRLKLAIDRAIDNIGSSENSAAKR